MKKGDHQLECIHGSQVMFKLATLFCLAACAYAAYYEDTIGEWIERINSDPESLFTAGYNEYFRGRSKEDIKVLMGTNLDDNRSSKARTVSKVLDGLPSSFTAGVSKWTNCRSTIFYIKDQGHCGSCWAVAASEVIADRICIANHGAMAPEDGEYVGQSRPQIDMSAEDILACCTYCSRGGCSGGGSPIDAMKYFNYDGVVTGGWYGSNCGCDPYTLPPCPHGCSGPKDRTPSCSKRCRSGYNKSWASDAHKGTDYYNIGHSQEAIMSEIYEHGPVECGFTVYENFHAYTTGIYHKIEGEKEGGHAIKIIGWGEENGTPYWLINNSWNTSWGDKGQVKFLRGKNLAGIESGCVASRGKSGDAASLSC